MDLPRRRTYPEGGIQLGPGSEAGEALDQTDPENQRSSSLIRLPPTGPLRGFKGRSS